MVTDPGGMDHWLVSHALADASPRVSISTNPQREGRPAFWSLPALRGFADGFVGGLIGGFIYCVVLAWFQIDGLDLACLRVVALSLVFAGFEMWRVTRRRTLKSVRACLLWTLVASALVLWALGAVSSVPERSRAAAPHQLASGLLHNLRPNVVT